MDVARLTEVIRRSEAVTCEAANYRGLTLSTLMQSGPEEVMSGRVCGRVKTKTASSNVVKAYVQFVKAAAALAEAAASLGTPEVPIQCIRETPGTRPGSASPRTPMVPALSRLQLSPDTMSSVDFCASPPATSQLLGLRNSDPDVPIHIGEAPSTPCPMAVPGAFEPVTPFSHEEPGALVKYQEPQQQHQRPQQQGVVSVIPHDRGQRSAPLSQADLEEQKKLMKIFKEEHVSVEDQQRLWNNTVPMEQWIEEQTAAQSGDALGAVSGSVAASSVAHLDPPFCQRCAGVIPWREVTVCRGCFGLFHMWCKVARLPFCQGTAAPTDNQTVTWSRPRSSKSDQSVQAAVAAVQSQPTSTPVVEGGWKLPRWLLFVGGTIFSRFRFTAQE